MSQKKKDHYGSLTKKSQVKRPKLSTIEIPSSWQTIPNIIFGDILMMVGLNSLEDLKKCRQVCQSWNVITAHMTKYEKDSIRREADCLAAQIRKKLKWNFSHKSLLPEITTAAILAYHGLFGSVEEMLLRDVDLASVPAEHLASLASCVTGLVFLNSARCDIIPVLKSIKTRELNILDRSLSSEETRALVRAMETRVEVVGLGGGEEVSLDIRALTQYSGQGKCRVVKCLYYTADRYREEVETWAQRINWQIPYLIPEYSEISAIQS